MSRTNWKVREDGGEEERQDGWLRWLREKSQEPGIRRGPNPKTNYKTKNDVVRGK